MLTSNLLQEIISDLCLEVSEETLKEFSREQIMTHSEYLYLEECLKKTMKNKLTDAFSGFCMN